MSNHPKTLFLCATAKSGLGHIRRLTLIAQALQQHHAGLRLILLCNAKVADMDAQDRALFYDIVTLPKSAMAAYAGSRSAAAVVVDTAVLPGLESLNCKRILVLRETIAEKLSTFALPANLAWDLLIAPNPPEDWQPPSQQVPANHSAAVGWIYSCDQTLANSHEQKGVGGSSGRVRDVLIASGGGGAPDWSDLADCLSILLAKLRSRVHCKLIVRQVIGPRASECHSIKGIDGVISNGSNLQSYFSRQDLVISTAGYNSVLELARTSVPVVLIPVARSFDDQSARVQRWGSTLGRPWGDAPNTPLLTWMQEVLEQGLRRHPVELGESGAALAAGLIANTVLEEQG